MVNEFGMSWMQPAIDSDQLLNQLVSKIRDVRELSELLDSTVTPIRQFLEIDRVNFYRLGSSGQLDVIAEAIKDDHLPALQGTSLAAQHIPAGYQERFSQERQRLVIDLSAGKTTIYAASSPGSGKDSIVHQANHPYYEMALPEMGVVTYLLVPIFHQYSLWGFLAGHHRQSKRFNHKQLHTLQILIDQISIGIAQAELVTRAHLQTQQEKLIGRISALWQNPLPAQTCEQQLLAELSQALTADGARLYVISEPMQQAAQIHTSGCQPDTPIDVEKNALWQRIMYGNNPPEQEPVFPIDDVYQQSILEPLYFALHQVQIRSLLIIPLRYNQQCIGCITLLRRATTSPQWQGDEIQLARALTVHLYTAVMQQRVERLFRHQSYYDLLTGLPNRLLLQQRLTLAVAEAQEQGALLAVLFLDLDRFKTINDSLGYGTGDRLLQMVTTRLKQTHSVYDLLGRWSSDEFVFLVSSFTDMAELGAVAKTILDALALPFEFDDALPCLGSNVIYMQASMGIAIAPYDGVDSETLFQNAAAALCRAKQKGRNYYEIYSAVISSKAVDQLRLENILYRAIDDIRQNNTAQPQFVLHYQPQIDLKTQQIIGLEALIRCIDGQGRFISPADFIPIAEETGLINQIGEWVLATACEQNKRWQDQGVGHFLVAVNLSVKQIQQANFVDIVLLALERSGLAPEYLEVEITESIAIQELQRTIEVLQQLRSRGIKVSLDDFGTGYSSLAALKHLPLDQLKVDRSFIKELTADSIDAGIVRTIVNLGHELKLQVIAEGVETVEQLDFLRSVSCDGVQGFLFSKPLPAQELVGKIDRGIWVAREFQA